MTKILVPLDGLPLSERVFSTVQKLAPQMQAEVLLVSVLDQRDSAHLGVEAQQRTEDYLQAVRDRELPWAQTRTLRAATVVRGILELIREENIDLVIMSSHGRSGAREQSMGSVARDLVRTSEIPVMLLGLSALERPADAP